MRFLSNSHLCALTCLLLLITGCSSCGYQTPYIISHQEKEITAAETDPNLQEEDQSITSYSKP